MMPCQETLPLTCHKSYDLVRHVLHELARYLTELSVCDGYLYTTYTSSQIAYASILLSMELFTSVALPLHVRETFAEAVCSASLLSGGIVLHSQSDEIKYLQDLLRESFWPEILVEECEYAEFGHPISVAKDFGLLDISQIESSQHRFVTMGTSSPHKGPTPTPFKELDPGDSPVCVNRHF